MHIGKLWSTFSKMARIVLVTAVAGSSQPWPALAGGPVPENRESFLPHVCVGGSNPGEVCFSNDGCLGGTCAIDVLSSPGTFPAQLTFMVDDDVSKFFHDETIGGVVAVTVLLRVKRAGQTHLLVQTYQNLLGSGQDELIENLRLGAFIGDTFDPVDEAKLNLAVANAEILGNFLFQEGDTELADTLRAIFGVTGKPAVLSIATPANGLAHSNHGTDGLASAVQLKVRIGFVPAQ